MQSGQKQSLKPGEGQGLQVHQLLSNVNKEHVAILDIKVKVPAKTEALGLCF